MQIEKRAFVASERFAPAMQKLFAIASAIDETSFVPKRDGFAYTAEAFKTHCDTHRVKAVQPVIDLKVEEATDSHLYCSSSFPLEITTTLSATK